MSRDLGSRYLVTHDEPPAARVWGFFLFPGRGAALKLTLKTGIATILWTSAIACAIVFSVHQDQVVLIWGIVTSAAAAVVSAMVAGDYIARDAAEFIVGKIRDERQATADRVLTAVRENAKAREDRVVSRVQSANEAALRRVVEEFARQIQSDGPTRLR